MLADRGVVECVDASAAGANATVAVVGFGLAALTPHYAPDSGPDRAEGAPDSWSVYVAIALSGLCALGAEVIWTRLLSLMLGPTVYTFSIILAVFLVGLGIGSSIGSLLTRGSTQPRLATQSLLRESDRLTQSTEYPGRVPGLSTTL